MSLFQFIKNNLSILDVVQEFASLKQAGNYYKGSCPFHSETDASFTVSPDKHMFYCFGCHASGDVISFVAKVENINQFEAAQYLVERYGIKVPKDLDTGEHKVLEASAHKRHAHLCREVARYCHEQLKVSPKARDYLTKRGITDETVKYFELGYLPGGMRNINRFIKEMSRVNILQSDLLESGFLIQGSRVAYSPFEERIMFPIRDGLGRNCGFGGRIFKPLDERAKYYNSRDSPFFSKGQLLFGLDLAKKEMQQKDSGFLVEGYTDCTAMAMAGYKNVVATLGTACSKDHLKKLARHLSTLYVLYDGDAAGQKAIVRMAELALDANLELRILRLPRKEDPASFLSGGGSLEQLMRGAEDIFAFFIDTTGSSFAAKPLSQKLSSSHKMVDLIGRVSDEFKQDVLLQRASAVTQLPFDSLRDLMRSRIAASKGHNEEPLGQPCTSIAQKRPAIGVGQLEKDILFAIIHMMDRVPEIVIEDDLLPSFSEKMHNLIQKLTTICKTAPQGQRLESFFSGLDGHQEAWIRRGMLSFGEGADENLLKRLLLKFRQEQWKKKVQAIKDELLSALQKEDTKRYEGLMEKFVGLKAAMKKKGLL